MTDRQFHRASLLIASVGTLLMLVTAIGRMDFGVDYKLPGFETSRPALQDWPPVSKARHAA